MANICNGILVILAFAFIPLLINSAISDYFVNGQIISAEAYSSYIASVRTFYERAGSQLGDYGLYLDSQVACYIQPCKNYLAFADCVSSLKEKSDDTLIDDFVVHDKKLMLVFLKLEEYSYECSDEFMITNLCGNTIEVHQRGSTVVKSSFRIRNLMQPSDSQIRFLDVSTLCSGEYDIWYVINSRGQKFIAFVKPFLIVNSQC